jgi:protein TonB
MLLVESNTHYLQTFIRMLSFTVVGAVITFLLFVLMHHLIKHDDVVLVPEKPVVFVSPMFEEPHEKVVTKQEPKPLEPVKAPPRIEQEVIETDSEIGIITEHQEVEIEQLRFTSEFVHTMDDRDVSPIVRVPPRYPPTAASQGLEGWVRLSFTINEVGEVENIEVVDAQPKRVFDRAAKRALARWKYKPQIEKGQAIVRNGLSVVLEFNLEQ